ncbi:MAG: PD-(D/E)XK nuclease family protein [Candidatus Latescibacterota bacterium]
MPFTVFTGPDPEANLNALFGRTPIRNGPLCAVTPDSRSVTDLEKTLARALGNAFTGHRILTMEGLARAVLSQAGPVPETVGPHIQRALAGELARKRVGAHSRFAALAAYPGFVDLLVSWLEDARSSEGQVAPDRELEQIASAYDVHLKRLGMTDHEGWVTLALANELVERFCRSLTGTFIAHGFYDLTDHQWQLLELFIRNARRSAATLVYDPARPELFALPGRMLSRFLTLGARIVEVAPRPAPGTGAILRGFRGGEYIGEADPDKVTIHTFRSVDSESDWIAGTIRSMLAAGVRHPGEIMIVSRFRPGFGSSLHTALRRSNVPVEGGIPRPLVHYPVIRLALAAVEASIHPDNEELIRTVRSSAYTGGIAFGDAGLGRDDRAWNCMVEVGSPEDFVLSVRKMLELLGVQERLDGGGDPVCAASEIAAYVRMQELLDEFIAFYTPLRRMMQAGEFARLLKQFLQDASLPDMPSPGRGVLVTDVTHARYISRPVVFITGLDNSAFPARTGGFSLHEPGFAQIKRTHAELEDPLLFYSSMQGAEKLYLTFPGIDDDGRDSTLSPYLREIREKNQTWLTAEFHHGVAGSAWEGGCCNLLGRAETALRFLKRERNDASGLLVGMYARDPALGMFLRNAIRTFISLAEDQGFRLMSPHSLEAVHRDWGDIRVYGVTDLETYAACPVRFFLARLLRLAVERESGGELDPADRGVIIHECLARFYRKRIDRGTPGFSAGDLETCRKEMRDTCEQVFTEQSEVFAALHPVAMLAEKKFILSWMEAFLDHEADYFQRQRFRPEYLEVDFGRSRRERQKLYPPLQLGEGAGKFSVGGRIDRIDVDRSGDKSIFRVIDYKSGSRSVSLRNLEAGRDLQLALYLKAALECILPGCGIHDGVFYSLRELDFSAYRLDRKPLEGSSWEEYIRIACGKAAEAVNGIRGGFFPVGDCARNGYCEYRPLCRGGRESAGEEAADAGS